MSLTPQILIYALFFCAGFLALQTMIGFGKQATVAVKHVNSRLRQMNKIDSQTAVLAKMKRSRGLTDGDHLKQFSEWMSQAVIQSGLPLGRYGIYYLMVVKVIIFALFLGLTKESWTWACVGGLAGLALPIIGLKFLVARRRNKAVQQLPEALDVIIRSLGAGHPVPVAMSLVAREMPDPIGSEFGLASDEVAFGSTIPAAIQRLSDRIGHEDFELFSAMIRLQEKTGGNLAELLASNAKTIRDRQRMRLRIKAASAEGRMSALILNAAPLLMFLGISNFAPDFYGDVEHSPILKYSLWGVVIWMAIGNLVMRKMINFKI